TCGGGLAREGVVSGDIDVECAGLFAGKPAPTVDFCRSQILRAALQGLGGKCDFFVLVESLASFL
ncbi:hypothetical protein ACW9JE_30605, partial [Pseudomonas sp. SDO55104_S430]